MSAKMDTDLTTINQNLNNVQEENLIKIRKLKK